MAKDEDDREMADVRLKKEFPSQGAAIGDASADALIIDNGPTVFGGQ